MKILLTGAQGQVGRSFQRLVAERCPDVTLLAADRRQLDITDARAVATLVSAFQPDVIVNAAAYTAVDRAESDRTLAFAVNARAPGYLAEAARQCQAHFVHFSTDYVFNSAGPLPLKEDEPCAPENVYGESKLAGEKEALSYERTTVIRTSWVFSEYGTNFLKTMLKLADSHASLSIVADQRGCPTYAGDIAALALDIALTGEKPCGIYHFCGQGEVSWFEFAESIFEQAQQEGMLSKRPQLTAIPATDYPLPAKRPAFSVLDTGKITDAGFPPAPWRDAVKCVLAQLRQHENPAAGAEKKGL